jgi:hypothetical protein
LRKWKVDEVGGVKKDRVKRDGVEWMVKDEGRRWC